VSGTAEPVAMELFDPCTVVPDEAIRAAGADPASLEQGPSTESGKWKHCTWTAPDYYLNISVTTRRIGELESNPNYVDVVGTEVPGRRGSLEYSIAPDSRDQMCVVASPWSGGSITVMINRKQSAAATRQPCLLAGQAARIVSPTLPN
jgi:hypothetical protein